MGRITKIGWCHHTHNGVHGCAHATLADGTESPGCQHCYAEKGSKRNPKTLGIWGEEGTRVLAADSAWSQLDMWHRAAVRDGEIRRVFCYSIGDVFEAPRSLANADVCAKGRALLFEAIERLRPVPHRPFSDGAKQAGLIFMLLTKRPENVKRMVPASWLEHVWLGTSVENQQAADERIPHLLDVPGVPVRFLSIEPLLEKIDIRMYLDPGAGARGDYLAKHGTHRASRVGWGIAGGESGHHARPCELAWLRDLRDQCKAAGVPFFNKQLGAKPFITETASNVPMPHPVPLQHPKGEDPAEWPEDLRVREVPEVRL